MGKSLHANKRCGFWAVAGVSWASLLLSDIPPQGACSVLYSAFVSLTGCSLVHLDKKYNSCR